MTSCNMNRCLELKCDAFVNVSILRKYAFKYASAFGWSIIEPTVVKSFDKASTSSSSGSLGPSSSSSPAAVAASFPASPSLRSFWMHVCMIRSVSMDFLNNSPMNRMFPNIRRRDFSKSSSNRFISRLRSNSSSSRVFTFGVGAISPSSKSSGFTSALPSLLASSFAILSASSFVSGVLQAFLCFSTSL